MEYVTLGRTGLKASAMGLGCGGPSKLGLATGGTPDQAAALVRAARDLGVNLFDTAEVYGTEEIVARGLAGVPRREVIISTKVPPADGDRPLEPGKLAARLDASLKRLRTDYVDIYHLHGLPARLYPHAARSLVPALEKLKADGKVRFIGVTEAFESDSGHAMLATAAQDRCWDVLMVGFNILNQCARERVLKATAGTGAGTLVMFAVRRALSRPERLKEVLQDLALRGKIESDTDPFPELIRDAGAGSLQDLAYRFCRQEPGLHVVLSGTGNADHLRRNAEYLDAPPLPGPVVARLRAAFAGVDDISGG